MPDRVCNSEYVKKQPKEVRPKRPPVIEVEDEFPLNPDNILPDQYREDLL